MFKQHYPNNIRFYLLFMQNLTQRTLKNCLAAPRIKQQIKKILFLIFQDNSIFSMSKTKCVT